MFCGIISMKSNLKKHTVLNQTGEKPFTPIFVASWPLRRPNGRSILHYSIQGRNTFQHVLWHHGQKEVTPEEAHCAEPNWREAYHCQFCGIMAITNTKLKEHTSLLHTREKPFPAFVVASWSVGSQT